MAFATLQRTNTNVSQIMSPYNRSHSLIVDSGDESLGLTELSRGELAYGFISDLDRPTLFFLCSEGKRDLLDLCD